MTSSVNRNFNAKSKKKILIIGVHLHLTMDIGSFYSPHQYFIIPDAIKFFEKKARERVKLYNRCLTVFIYLAVPRRILWTNLSTCLFSSLPNTYHLPLFRLFFFIPFYSSDTYRRSIRCVWALQLTQNVCKKYSQTNCF